MLDISSYISKNVLLWRVIYNKKWLKCSHFFVEFLEKKSLQKNKNCDRITVEIKHRKYLQKS
jgi:hypothetical protein